MNHFFKVKTLKEVISLVSEFQSLDVETVDILEAYSRVLAKDIYSDQDIPGFKRATMDGYAVSSASTFGASESNPAWLEIIGSIAIGDVPDFSMESGQAAKISTGGMLPKGADSVVMVEHTEAIGGGDGASQATADKTAASYNPTVEIYKSVAPLQNVIESDEDFQTGQKVLEIGTVIRPQEVGLAAALGICRLPVYKIPKVGIISTGDEIVPIEQTPPFGKIRDINSYTLAGLIIESGAKPVLYGIVKDNEESLYKTCSKAVAETDMVIISGGSSVGTRDFTVNVLSSLKDTEILVHGISISPGKPTILAKSGSTHAKPIWGLPGHVVSAMVVFKVVVAPFLNKIRGFSVYDIDSENKEAASRTTASLENIKIPAVLARNVASAQGRTDFIRVKLVRKFDLNSKDRNAENSSSKDKNELFAEPIIGKSGLIRTMIMADGLLEIGENVEGLEKGEMVDVIPLRAFS